MGSRICFVNPPFFDIYRPSIALGILQAVLRSNGFAVDVHYANMWYASAVGLEAYRRLSRARPEDALGDWLFGGAAFPDFAPDHDSFLTQLLELRSRIVPEGVDAKQWLMGLRRDAVSFIESAVDRIMEGSPKIVGCTSTFCQHGASLAILKAVKKRAPDVVTMMGGANCETVMGRTTHANFPWVDYVVSGEAEDLAVPLCRGAMEYGAEMPASKVPYGVFAPVHRQIGYPSIKAGDGVPRAVAMDINAVPNPDYADFFSEVARSPYRAGLVPNLLIETSRGCWWGQVSHCTFCGLNGNNMSFRSKKPELVLKQMDELVERYGVRRIEAVDNILDHHFFNSVLSELADSTRKYMLFYETKSNLSKKQVEMLSRAGVRTIQPGIESLDTRVLELMKKGVAAWQNVRLLKWARQFGVRAQWSAIYGFPGEEDSWYAETTELLPKLHHLQAGGAHAIRFDRFSPYHTNPEASGLNLVPYEFYKYAFPLHDDELASQAYFFLDANKPRLDSKEGLSARPGVRKYIEAAGVWAKASSAIPKPVCVLFERDGKTWLNDTRPAFAQGMREINALEQKILTVADDGVAAHKLAELVAQDSDWASDLIERTMRNLDKRGLLLFLDKRALSLPLRFPVRKYPSVYQLPIGSVRDPESAPAAAAAPDLRSSVSS